jgi:hypothetical protein
VADLIHHGQEFGRFHLGRRFAVIGRERRVERSRWAIMASRRRVRRALRSASVDRRQRKAVACCAAKVRWIKLTSASVMLAVSHIFYGSHYCCIFNTEQALDFYGEAGGTKILACNGATFLHSMVATY